MGKRFALILFIMLLGTLSMSRALAQDAEKEAIKKVVIAETEAFLAVDQKAWADTWLQVPYAYWSFSNKKETQFVDGWEKIQETFGEYFKNQKPSRSKITPTWQEIRVYGNGAYVRFSERTDDGHTVETTDQIRVLEKKDGKWKMVCMIAAVR